MVNRPLFLRGLRRFAVRFDVNAVEVIGTVVLLALMLAIGITMALAAPRQAVDCPPPSTRCSCGPGPPTAPPAASTSTVRPSERRGGGSPRAREVMRGGLAGVWRVCDGESPDGVHRPRHSDPTAPAGQVMRTRRVPGSDIPGPHLTRTGQ